MSRYDLNPVSRVLLQSRKDQAVVMREKNKPPVVSDADFQLNSLGGPLDEDFT